MRVDNRKDIILLLLYVAGYSGNINEPIEGLTRLQKLLFLLDKEYNINKLVPNYFSFRAFNYGPFDEAVFSDIEALVNYGLVEKLEEGKHIPEDLTEKYLLSDYFFNKEDGAMEEILGAERVELFKLTPKGIDIAKQLFSSLNPEIQGDFIKLKKRFNHKSLTSLIKYVYSHFPDYTEFSKLEY